MNVGVEIILFWIIGIEAFGIIYVLIFDYFDRKLKELQSKLRKLEKK